VTIPPDLQHVLQVGSKADVASQATAEAFQAWAKDDLFPPKGRVLLSANGQLDPACLSEPRSAAAAAGLLLKASGRSSRARQQHQNKQQQPMQELHILDNQQQQRQQDQQEQEPQAGQPARVLGQPNGSSSSSGGTVHHSSCGWVFHESDVFDRQQLLALLQGLQPVVARIKGVFRVGAKQWVMPAASTAAVEATEAAQTGSAAAGSRTTTDMAAAAAAVATGDAAGVADGVQDVVSTGSGDALLQLLEVCYRGPSMVEVILDHQQKRAQHPAAAVGAQHDMATALQGWAVQAQQQQQQQRASPGTTPSSVSATAGDVWLQLEAALLACRQLQA
jgi:hypothetical protein